MPAGERCSAPASRFAFTPIRTPPAGPAGRDHPHDPQVRWARADRPRRGSSRISFPVRLTLPACSGDAPACPFASAVFHVSGCSPRCRRRRGDAHRRGSALSFAGEAEDRRLDTVLRDAWNGTLGAALQPHERPAGPAGRETGADPAAPALGVRTSGTIEHRPRCGCPDAVLFCTITTSRAARAATAAVRPSGAGGAQN